MRYLPLVWSAVARRPARAILTLLSMTMAFLLVGMMLGFNGFFQRLEEIARANCIYVGARFDGADHGRGGPPHCRDARSDRTSPATP